MVWMQRTGTSGSSSAIQYYKNYSMPLHLQHSSAKKKKSDETIEYSSQLILIANTSGKGSLFLGTHMAPRMTKEPRSCWNTNLSCKSRIVYSKNAWEIGFIAFRIS